MVKFCRLELRTTDADAARAFYAKLFGHDRAVVWPLHEQALARGARPHWLGYLDVSDVERTIAAFVQRGATRLGPAPPTGVGGQASVLRDPGGAIVAVSSPPTSNANSAVDAAWHVLNTTDATQAAANYHELFGWEIQPRVEVPAQGVFHPFAWQAGGPSVGAIADITGMAGRHAHWLFFFRVDALDSAIAATQAAGGLVLDPTVLPSGERICVCDDPQGAAFALWEPQAST
jgi:predicted enzyme related to lactoylglutathione lyase